MALNAYDRWKLSNAADEQEAGARAELRRLRNEDYAEMRADEAREEKSDD